MMKQVEMTTFKNYKNVHSSFTIPDTILFVDRVNVTFGQNHFDLWWLQIWKTNFQVGFSYGFKFVNFRYFLENTYNIFEKYCSKTVFASISTHFVCRNGYLTCIQAMYPTFDFLRPNKNKNDKKFDFLTVTLIGEIIRVEEEIKLKISNQHKKCHISRHFLVWDN